MRKAVKRSIKGISYSLVMAFCATAPSVNAASGAEEAARELLEREFLHLGDEVQVEILPSRHDLSQCEAPSPFLKDRRSNRAGRLYVGISCSGARPSTVYLPAQITVRGSYVVARQRIDAGTVINAGMLETRQGDITTLLDRVILSPRDAVGRVAGRSVAAGAVLKQQNLQEVQLVERGQPVTFQYIGEGFRIAGKGEALQSGNAGDLVRVRTEQRKLVAGIVSPQGIVTISP